MNTLIPTIQRELSKRILREKPQRKTRLIHPLSSSRDSSNPSTLFLSIVKSLRGLLPKHFLTISISMRGLFGALGSSQEGTNFTLVDTMVKQRNPGSQKRNRFSATSLEQRSLKGLGTLGRLGLEGLLLFMYPNYIFQWITYRLEGGGEVLHRGLRFPLR